MADDYEKKAWSEHKKIAWWIGFVALVASTSGMVVGMGKWFYTRASIEDVDKKADKEDVKETVKGINKRIDKSEKLLNNVHINLIKLMVHSDVEPAKKSTIEFEENGPEP